MTQSSTDINDMNQTVFNRLKELLRDDRRKIKINACSALADEDGKFHTIPDKRTYETIEVLIDVAKNDLDGFVRRKAEHSANIVREWIKDWASKPLLINSDSTSNFIRYLLPLSISYLPKIGPWLIFR